MKKTLKRFSIYGRPINIIIRFMFSFGKAKLKSMITLSVVKTIKISEAHYYSLQVSPTFSIKCT